MAGPAVAGPGARRSELRDASGMWWSVENSLRMFSQCKEIEENNRMGKTRDHFKKIKDTKGTFHAKRGTIKDRNGMDLTEAEDIRKRVQEYTEELYKKNILMTQITRMV